MGVSYRCSAVSGKNRRPWSEKRQACLGKRCAEADVNDITFGSAPSWESLFLAGGSAGRWETASFSCCGILGDLDGALRKVEKTERDYRDSALVLSATYEAHGLYEEALAQVEKLSDKNKDLADLAQNMRRRLHLQLEKE